MAIFPCDRTGHRYLGKQNSFYVALSAGAEMNRYRLRFCGEHAREAMDQLGPYLVDPGNLAVADYGGLAKCMSCLRPVVNGGQMLFVTVYLVGEERTDYWAQLHNTCLPPRELGPLAG